MLEVKATMDRFLFIFGLIVFFFSFVFLIFNFIGDFDSMVMVISILVMLNASIAIGISELLLRTNGKANESRSGD